MKFLDKFLRYLKGESFQKGRSESQPLLKYPLTAIPEDDGTSRLVSPRIGKPHGIAPPNAIGSEAFAEEFDDLIACREEVSRGVWPSDILAKYHPRKSFDPNKIPGPLQLRNINTRHPGYAANVVRMDHPLDLHFAILDWIQKEKIPLKGGSKHKEFLGRIVHPITRVSVAISEKMEKAFEVKSFYGRLRPEEALGLPGAMVTHYKAGCPCHASYVAGHGTFCGCAKEFENDFQFDQSQWWEVFDSAYHWAMYRSFSLMHWPTDNTAGLALGGYRDLFKGLTI